MVRILVASDVHTEFHADHGQSFFDDLGPRDVDLVVLAGDIAVGPEIPVALGMVCQRFAGADVVYVHGNHEFYGTNRAAVLAWTAEAERANPNLHVLDCRVVTLRGRRVLGAPLWFRRDAAALQLKRAMNDFNRIEGFESWVFAENARAAAFFAEELRAGDIVVTHHLPAEESVSPQYRGHPLTPFFLCDVSELIAERGPALWVHGHTHDTLDYRLGETRVVCNPFGYAQVEENGAFSFERVIDVE